MNLLHRFAAAIASLCVASGVSAQYLSPAGGADYMDPGHPFTIFDNMRINNVLNHLDLGLNIGSSGVGLELAAPLTDWARVRAGVDVMPHINIPMHFNVVTYADGQVGNNFDRVQEIMTQLTNYDMDEVIDMKAKPTGVNFRFMVDVMPIPSNRNWHLTVGFLVGSNKMGTVANTPEEMPSLLMMNLYNYYYDFLAEKRYLDEPLLPGITDVDLSPDEYEKIFEKMEPYGHLGMHVGDFKDGTPYIMEPGNDGMVKASAFVNRFKPYVGIGYNGAPARDKRFKIGFDLGVLFWGGAPQVITHDGTNLTRDVRHISGKVGDYMGLIRGLKVCPSLSFKMSYTLF